MSFRSSVTHGSISSPLYCDACVCRDARTRSCAARLLLSSSSFLSLSDSQFEAMVPFWPSLIVMIPGVKLLNFLKFSGKHEELSSPLYIDARTRSSLSFSSPM